MEQGCARQLMSEHLQVYDVSKFSDHPGGRVLYTAAGSDATDSFRAFHTNAASDMLERYYVGELDGKVEALSAFEKEFRDLIGQLRAEGLFKSRCVHDIDVSAHASPRIRRPVGRALPLTGAFLLYAVRCTTCSSSHQQRQLLP